MPAVVRQGDKNSGGGSVQHGVESVIVNNKQISVKGNPVTGHGDHDSTKTNNTQETVFADSKPVIRVGDKDHCGHTRIDGSDNVFVG